MKNILNEELGLFQIASFDDGMGGFTLETRDLGTIWAKVTSEEVTKGKRVLHVTVRAEYDFSPDYYLAYEGERYRVSRVSKNMKNRKFVELVAVK